MEGVSDYNYLVFLQAPYGNCEYKCNENEKALMLMKQIYNIKKENK